MDLKPFLSDSPPIVLEINYSARHLPLLEREGSLLCYHNDIEKKTNTMSGVTDINDGKNTIAQKRKPFLFLSIILPAG